MKIKDKSKPKLPPLEPGAYAAVCIGFVDLGEQYSELFKSYANKGMYIWEIPGETVEVDGEQKPRQLSKEFTISGDKKSNLRKIIESWNGKSFSDEEIAEFEVLDMVGKPCLLNVVLNATGEYANVDNIMQMPKGFPVPVSSSEQIRWEMDKWNDEVFAKLPEWIQEKIEKSTEYQRDHAPETSVEVKTVPEAGSVQECPI